MKILHKTVETFNNRNNKKIVMDIITGNKVEVVGTIVSYRIPADYKYEL